MKYNIKIMNYLPLDIQLLILNYYNEIKFYFVKYVLPLIKIKNRIKLFYKNDEYIYISDKKHHYLINVYNIIDKNNKENEMFKEFEFEEIDCLIDIKNIWIMIHITSLYNYIGGVNNEITEIIYINKYDYNFFLIKTKHNDICYSTNIFNIKKIISLSNYCNYYSCEHFYHLPDNAIDKINNYHL